MASPEEIVRFKLYKKVKDIEEDLFNNCAQFIVDHPEVNVKLLETPIQLDPLITVTVDWEKAEIIHIKSRIKTPMGGFRELTILWSSLEKEFKDKI